MDHVGAVDPEEASPAPVLLGHLEEPDLDHLAPRARLPDQRVRYPRDEPPLLVQGPPPPARPPRSPSRRVRYPRAEPPFLIQGPPLEEVHRHQGLRDRLSAGQRP